ncbi:MAG: phosphotransferase family protein [Lysobacteraceae bacterium]|nr:MAG: phosphotransferase family protein [Xanthomonadaceae bacterium]
MGSAQVAQQAATDFELGALHDYMARHIEGFAGPLTAARFKGGQSNPTYLLSTPGRQYVMRSKPAPVSQLLPSAHAIEREFRLQSALAGSAVPVARMHCLCEDESVIGRAFYLMDFVEGRIFWEQALPDCAREERAALYDELNRVIAALHAVDVAAVGLADYGKAGNYFSRQVDRWTRQYRASSTGDIEAMERLIEWLPRHVPEEDQPQVSLVHGDYRLDNVIFHPSEARILSVIDWELSTLGHPLADFAYHLMSWHIAPGGAMRGLGGLDLQALGIPSEHEYIRAYERRMGRSISGDWNYYLAYNLFRISAILQGIAMRVQDGTASSPQAAEYGRQARPLAELGWQFAQRAGGS